MNIRDGYAMKVAVESGYNVCIISGGSNEGVRLRLRNLGITDIHLGTPDKVETLRNMLNYIINPEHIWDDIPDFHVEINRSSNVSKVLVLK
jgi:3-deoxy-D-manno-octulosonate 8-phosphate phosphatase (KDO 8-P phosphatase)